SGPAVHVQARVCGNRGAGAGTGAPRARPPATGENQPYGDFLRNAQGEDVVAGIREVEKLDVMAQHFPECHAQLLGVMKTLEHHYRDMCDIEFTIEQGRLFLLQTRVGKRTAAAALRMAVEMVDEASSTGPRPSAVWSRRSSISSCTHSSTPARRTTC